MAIILIIEDDLPSRAILSGLMQAAGHKCVGLRSIQKDLLLSLGNIVDLILCDIVLPDLDGYEIARTIRQAFGRHPVALVAVTAQAMHGDRERILAAGFDGYFSKPISPRSFARQVEVFLPGGVRSRSPAALAPAAACG